MIRSRIKADDLIKKLNNTVKYSNGFISELNKSKALLNQKVGNTSIAAFYDYQPSGVVMWRDGKITWGSLNSIPASVIRLQELRQLTLKYLPVIKQLPEECCMLTGLKHLILQSLPRLERLPVSFRGFKTQLHSLKLIDLPALQDMPTCFEGTILTDIFELID